MTEDFIAVQILGFFIAGFDTTGNSLGLALYQLAKHQEKQNKLRQELQKIIATDGSFTYENITNAEYLDAVLNGTFC